MDDQTCLCSRDESRMASPDLMALHSAQIETFVRKALSNGSSGGSSGSSGGSGLPEMIGDVKTSEIPGPDFLQVWSLTLFYFVDSLQSKISWKRCIFYQHTFTVCVS